MGAFGLLEIRPSKKVNHGTMYIEVNSGSVCWTKESWYLDREELE